MGGWGSLDGARGGTFIRPGKAFPLVGSCHVLRMGFVDSPEGFSRGQFLPTVTTGGRGGRVFWTAMEGSVFAHPHTTGRGFGGTARRARGE